MVVAIDWWDDVVEGWFTVVIGGLGVSLSLCDQGDGGTCGDDGDSGEHHEDDRFCSACLRGRCGFLCVLCLEGVVQIGERVDACLCGWEAVFDVGFYHVFKEVFQCIGAVEFILEVELHAREWELRGVNM